MLTSDHFIGYVFTAQALAELEEAGLGAVQVDQLWGLYTEARRLQEEWSGEVAGNEGQPQPAGPTQNTQANRAGVFALGVLSRLLTVLQLMYSVSHSFCKRMSMADKQTAQSILISSISTLQPLSFVNAI